MRWRLSVAGLTASWGFISVIVAGVELDAVVLVFYRLVLAAVALTIALLVVRRGYLLRLPKASGRLFLVGGTLAVHWFLFFATIKLSSVAFALLTVYTAPILLALLAPFMLEEARSRAALVALVPAGAGLALIAGRGGEAGGGRPLAVAAGLAAALTYALLVIGTKQLGERLPVATIEVWLFTVAALVLAPFLLGADRVMPHGDELWLLAVLGIAFTAGSGLLYVWLLRRVTAQTMGVLSYIEPVSGALLAWAILGEALGGRVLIGGALVVLAGLLVVVTDRPRREGRAPVKPGLAPFRTGD